MRVRTAIIILIVLVLCIIGLLSLAAYTVKEQNKRNASEQHSATIDTTPPTEVPSTAREVPHNDAVNTDVSSVQYKRVAGNGFSFEVPLSWNSFEETVNGCTAQAAVQNNIQIVVWPATCELPFSFTQTVSKNDFMIGGTFASDDIVQKAIYNHAIATLVVY